MEPTPQWKKRVDVFCFIYSVNVIDDLSTEQIKKKAFEENLFDKQQLAIIDYFADHRKEIIEIISNNLAEGWTYDRISQVDKAIIITAYCESKVNKLDKAIIIDQSLITVKHYSDDKSIKYINAILDRIIK